MAKCIGRMPECQYFTTGGCVSPFNCLYKAEGTYSNSTTSDTACYAGTSYTEAQPDESEAGIRKWYRESVGHEPANYDAAALKAYIAHLEAENAELQEKDINCVNSVDEMTMCDGCGLFDCCGCEHSYVAVQGVKELKYRAERAERAVENLAYKRAKTLLDDDSKEAMEKIKQAELQQAEKELAEEGK